MLCTCEMCVMSTTHMLKTLNQQIKVHSFLVHTLNLFYFYQNKENNNKNDWPIIYEMLKKEKENLINKQRKNIMLHKQ